MDKIVDYINVNRDRYVEQLKEYLAIPSISALPAHAADVRRCAEWTAAELTRIGLHERPPDGDARVTRWSTPSGSAPPGAPTILFYGHYDVQPVDPVELWTSPPFEATVRDGELYARGAVDDKGQVFMHMKAIEAHLSQQGRLPVNIKVLLEGEEEVGSANLDDFVRANKAHARRRRRRDQRLADVRSRHPVDLLRPARPGLLPDRRARQQVRSALGLLRRRAWSIRPWRWRRCWRR